MLLVLGVYSMICEGEGDDVELFTMLEKDMILILRLYFAQGEIGKAGTTRL